MKQNGLVSNYTVAKYKLHKAKGCSYDNAVAEATFKIFKIEFAINYHFYDLEQLELMLADYVNWFNNIRIHSTLGYLSPKEYKLHNLKKVV